MTTSHTPHKIAFLVQDGALLGVMSNDPNPPDQATIRAAIVVIRNEFDRDDEHIINIRLNTNDSTVEISTPETLNQIDVAATLREIARQFDNGTAIRVG